MEAPHHRWPSPRPPRIPTPPPSSRAAVWKPGQPSSTPPASSPAASAVAEEQVGGDSRADDEDAFLTTSLEASATVARIRCKSCKALVVSGMNFCGGCGRGNTARVQHSQCQCQCNLGKEEGGSSCCGGCGRGDSHPPPPPLTPFHPPLLTPSRREIRATLPPSHQGYPITLWARVC